MKKAAQNRHSGACIYSNFRQPLETIFCNLHFEFPHTYPELAEGTNADAVPARSRHGGFAQSGVELLFETAHVLTGSPKSWQTCESAIYYRVWLRTILDDSRVPIS